MVSRKFKLATAGGCALSLSLAVAAIGKGISSYWSRTAASVDYIFDKNPGSTGHKYSHIYNWKVRDNDGIKSAVFVNGDEDVYRIPMPEEPTFDTYGRGTRIGGIEEIIGYEDRDCQYSDSEPTGIKGSIRLREDVTDLKIVDKKDNTTLLVIKK